MGTDSRPTTPKLDAAAHPSVQAAIRATFGNTVPEALEPLHEGLSSSSLFKLTIGGRAYVLRRVNRPDPLNDPRRQFACMSSASERGIAPRVLYADADQGVCITEFIHDRSLMARVRTGEDVVEELAALLRRIHTGPAFPRLMGIPEAVGIFCGRLRQNGAEPALAQELLARVEEARAALEPHRVEVPCHNDLNPNNILFDGERLWVIDWETACAGEPFHDLATLTLFVVTTPAGRERLLHAYLGRAPSEVERARLLLSRQVALAFWAMGFFSAAQAQGVPLSGLETERLPGLAAAIELRRAGASPPGADGLAWLARVLVQEMLAEAAAPASQAALEVLRFAPVSGR